MYAKPWWVQRVFAGLLFACKSGKSRSVHQPSAFLHTMAVRELLLKSAPCRGHFRSQAMLPIQRCAFS